MSETLFEYEERFKESDPLAIKRKLELAKFTLSHVQTQIDHWFIPQSIMSPDEQANWFDFELGYALRIREETNDKSERVLITSKRLLRQADHSAMTNNEAELTTRGMIRVLSPMGSEFNTVIETLKNRDWELTFDEAKSLIESAGRKEYITIAKTRHVYRHRDIGDVEVDIDEIPALRNTELGFWASVEIEYMGEGTLEEARQRVRTIGGELGYETTDILKKALPGLAIPYLARF